MSAHVHIDDRTRFVLDPDGYMDAFSAGVDHAEVGGKRPEGNDKNLKQVAFVMGYDAWHRDKSYRDERAKQKQDS